MPSSPYLSAPPACMLVTSADVSGAFNQQLGAGTKDSGLRANHECQFIGTAGRPDETVPFVLSIMVPYRDLLSSYGGFGIKRRARPMLGQSRPCAAAKVINRDDRRDAMEIVATTIADRIGSVGDQRTTAIQSCWFGCGRSPISAAVNQAIMTLTNQLATAPATQVHAEVHDRPAEGSTLIERASS